MKITVKNLTTRFTGGMADDPRTGNHVWASGEVCLGGRIIELEGVTLTEEETFEGHGIGGT